MEIQKLIWQEGPRLLGRTNTLLPTLRQCALIQKQHEQNNHSLHGRADAVVLYLIQGNLKMPRDLETPVDDLKAVSQAVYKQGILILVEITSRSSVRC